MDKKCSRCLDVKPVEDFGIRKASKDGYTAACKNCLSAYDRSRANLPHRVEMRSAYQKTEAGKVKSEAAKAAWRTRNQDRRAAHQIANNALRDGRLQRQLCLVCGAEAEMHHAAYDYPLAVSWLCDSHHKQLHKEHRQYLRTKGE